MNTFAEHPLSHAVLFIVLAFALEGIDCVYLKCYSSHRKHVWRENRIKKHREELNMSIILPDVLFLQFYSKHYFIFAS